MKLTVYVPAKLNSIQPAFSNVKINKNNHHSNMTDGHFQDSLKLAIG